MKLKSKKEFNYKGKVYDLTVNTEDHSYNINNTVVHNSAGGSLVLFVLDITKIDPIKHGLIFERFLNPARCLHEDTLVYTPSGEKQLKNINIGDFVLSENKKFEEVIEKHETEYTDFIKIYFENDYLLVSKDHKIPVIRDGIKQTVLAKDITELDELLILKDF